MINYQYCNPEDFPKYDFQVKSQTIVCRSDKKVVTPCFKRGVPYFKLIDRHGKVRFFNARYLFGKSFCAEPRSKKAKNIDLEQFSARYIIKDGKIRARRNATPEPYVRGKKRYYRLVNNEGKRVVVPACVIEGKCIMAAGKWWATELPAESIEISDFPWYTFTRHGDEITAWRIAASTPLDGPQVVAPQSSGYYLDNYEGSSTYISNKKLQQLLG